MDLAASSVYVVQQHLRYDRDTGQMRPRYNLDPAKKWGKLRVLLHDRMTLAEPNRTVAKLALLLSTFSDDDYLLCIGHPVLIGWATTIAAAHNNGRIKQLVWSGERQDYAVIESTLPICFSVV